MHRLTIYLNPAEDWVGPDETRRILTKQLMTGIALFDIHEIVRDGVRIAIRARAEVTPWRFREAIAPCAGELRARYDAAVWGWPGYIEPPAAPSTEPRPDRDPYAEIGSQQGETRTYTVWPMQTWYLAVLLAGSLVLAVVKDAGFLLLTAGAVAVIAAIQFSRVTADREGIRIQYWLRQSQIILWEEICGARIFPERSGPYCLLQGSNVRIPGWLAFKVANMAYPTAGIGEGDVLLKTVLTRARLTYVSGSPLGVVTYKRGDAA